MWHTPPPPPPGGACIVQIIIFNKPVHWHACLMRFIIHMSADMWSCKGETMNMQGVSQIYTLVYITNTRGGACMTLKYGFIAWIYMVVCINV